MRLNPKKRTFQRRDFLKLLGLSGLSTFLAQCGLLKENTSAPAIEFSPTATQPPAPTATQPALPTPEPTAAPTAAPTATPAYTSLVATAKADSYDLDLVRAELAHMLDNLGGLGELIQPGARVGIKPNLTAGSWIDGIIPAPATEMYTTHPAVVQALAELLIDAGAGKIFIMEGMYDNVTYQKWGYADAAQATGAELVDLCSPAPYGDYIDFPVGPDYFIYDQFKMNALLGEIDVFVSVAKMKCHTSSGVTLSMKNLFGLPPYQLYRRSESHTHRSWFHGDASNETRVPRVILDLNRARPVHLAVIDGIMTVEAAAGPWDQGAAQIKPGVLAAGFDPVAVDAVSTAVMGFDPTAAPHTMPFEYCDNHLSLAAEIGLGTNLLDEIGIRGVELEDLITPFKPALATSRDWQGML